jgi:hypothetical protein
MGPTDFGVCANVRRSVMRLCCSIFDNAPWMSRFLDNLSRKYLDIATQLLYIQVALGIDSIFILTKLRFNWTGFTLGEVMKVKTITCETELSVYGTVKVFRASGLDFLVFFRKTRK